MRKKPQTVLTLNNEGRNSYVIAHMTDAVLALLREKSLDDISISELCDQAGVGRASFYRNFGVKENVVKCRIDSTFRKWMECYDRDGNLPLNEQLGGLFHHFEDHRSFYQLLNERGLIFLLKDVIMDVYGPKSENQMFEAYMRAYAANVLYGWIEVWFMRGMKDSAEDISDLFKSQGL